MAEGGSKLSEEQIYECLKSLNVPVRMNDLKTPSREFIVRVFECFIKDLQIDITGNELRTWEATNHLEDREMYEEAMFLTLLAMAVNHITNPCGLNITIKDIVEPKPKRTKKILNYLLVFWNYYLQKCAHFHKIEESYEEERKKAEDLILENQSLDEKHDDMLNVLNSMQPKDEISDIVAVKGEKESKLKMESESLRTEYQGMKTKEANIRTEIGAIEVRIVTAKQTIEELEQLILSSPERINTEIQKLQDKIKSEDLKIKEVENRSKDAAKNLQFLEEYKIEEGKDMKALDGLTDSITHLGETVKCTVSSHQKIDEEEDRLRRLQMEVNRKEESKFQQEQKSAKIVLSSKKQIETLQEVLKMNLNEESNLKRDIEFIKAADNEVQEHIDSETNDILDVIAKCKNADARSKERKARYITKMKEIESAFKSDCNEILEGIKAIFPYEVEKDNML